MTLALHAGLATRAGLCSTAGSDPAFGRAGFYGKFHRLYSTFAFGLEAAGVFSPAGAPAADRLAGPNPQGLPVLRREHRRRGRALALSTHDLQRKKSRQSPSHRRRRAALVGPATPATGIDARFSPEYVFAAALTDGSLGIGHFDERPARADLLGLSAKVSRRHHGTARRLSPTTRFVVMESVTKKDGTRCYRAASAGFPALMTRPKNLPTRPAAVKNSPVFRPWCGP